MRCTLSFRHRPTRDHPAHGAARRAPPPETSSLRHRPPERPYQIARRCHAPQAPNGIEVCRPRRAATCSSAAPGISAGCPPMPTALDRPLSGDQSRPSEFSSAWVPAAPPRSERRRSPPGNQCRPAPPRPTRSRKTSFRSTGRSLDVPDACNREREERQGAPEVVLLVEVAVARQARC